MAVRKRKTTKTRKKSIKRRVGCTRNRKSVKRGVRVAKRKTTRRMRKKSLLDKILDF